DGDRPLPTPQPCGRPATVRSCGGLRGVIADAGAYVLCDWRCGIRGVVRKERSPRAGRFSTACPVVNLAVVTQARVSDANPGRDALNQDATTLDTHRETCDRLRGRRSNHRPGPDVEAAPVEVTDDRLAPEGPVLEIRILVR